MTEFIVGSINTPGPWFHATGEGVTACKIDETTGEISRVRSYPEFENAMWMAKSGRFTFVATERFMDGGEVVAFDPTMAATGPVQKTPGGAICNLAVSPDGKTLYTVSYLGGVTVHTIDDNGVISPVHQEINYTGSGPNKERQEKSHPHQAVVSPDGKHLFVCDLGCDKVWIHPIEGSRLGPAASIAAAAGSGPRHLVFHPRLPRFYLLGELDAQVRVYEGSGADWKLVGSHSAIPENFTGTPGGGAIRLHPSGKTLAVSVRGSDTIAVFHIDAHGDITLAANFPTGGKTPRDFDFTPSGRRLVALNQDSDNAVAFGFDPASGLPTGHAGAPFALGCPMCVIF
jgi:6-phosphogluconolactonase